VNGNWKTLDAFLNAFLVLFYLGRPPPPPPPQRSANPPRIERRNQDVDCRTSAMFTGFFSAYRQIPDPSEE
jgi:hypothetical protein